jgi:hypothetical protein
VVIHGVSVSAALETATGAPPAAGITQSCAALPVRTPKSWGDVGDH